MLYLSISINSSSGGLDEHTLEKLIEWNIFSTTFLHPQN
jgi:hypothetical protein